MKIGSTARPDQVVAVDDLPKTRSGKIMCHILRGIAEGKKDPGDTSTLAEPASWTPFKSKPRPRHRST